MLSAPRRTYTGICGLLLHEYIIGCVSCPQAVKTAQCTVPVACLPAHRMDIRLLPKQDKECRRCGQRRNDVGCTTRYTAIPNEERTSYARAGHWFNRSDWLSPGTNSDRWRASGIAPGAHGPATGGH